MYQTRYLQRLETNATHQEQLDSTPIARTHTNDCNQAQATTGLTTNHNDLKPTLAT
jgi:hypothetical protein